MDFGTNKTQSKTSSTNQNEEKISNHMLKSVIAAVLFTVAGVVPLVYSFLVDIRIDQGNLSAARKYSEKANNWANAIIIIGAAVIGLAFIFGVSSYLSGYSSIY